MGNLLQKKRSELTKQDIATIYKTIGTTGVPYPGLRAEIDVDGTSRMEIGSIVSDGHNETAILIPSNLTYKQVVHFAYATQPIPSALPAQREIFQQMGPKSRSLATMILSLQGWGKTEIAKNAALIQGNPLPPLFVNCSNLDLEELIWTPAIDLGEDYKMAIRSRLRHGLLLPDSMALLERAFPAEGLIRDSDGRIIDLDFAKLAIPHPSKLKPSNGNLNDIDFSQIANARDRRLQEELIKKNIDTWTTIASNEVIPLHSTNIVGFRKIPGPVKVGHEEARFFIADEFTKGRNVSHLLEILQWWSNGGADNITVTSTMNVYGRDETSQYQLRRDDIRVGHGVIMTGNLHDPLLDHLDASLMSSRIPQHKLDKPQIWDWEARASQIFSGVPVSTHLGFFHRQAQDDMPGFRDFLSDIGRGKSEVIGTSVPLGHTLRLQNIENLHRVVQKISRVFDHAARLFDMESDYYDHNKHAEDQGFRERYRKLSREIDTKFTKNNPIDPRLLIDLVNRANEGRAQVKKIDHTHSPHFNPLALEQNFVQKPIDELSIQADFGTFFEAQVKAWILRATVGCEEIRKDLIAVARHEGVAFTSPGQPDTVASLLNQDMFTDMGGLKSVLAIRDALAKVSSDTPEMLIEQAVAACNELNDLPIDNNQGPRRSNVILLGLGRDSVGVFNTVDVVDHIAREDRPDPRNLISSSDFLESLKVPAVATINLRNIWRQTISQERLIPGDGQYDAVVQLAEGTHSSKIGITTLMTRGKNGQPIPFHVVQDLEREENLLVTDDVDASTRAELSKDYVVVSYSDSNAEARVTEFLRDTLRHPARKQNIAELERLLTHAFMLRAGNENNIQPLAQMMVERTLPAEAAVYIMKKLG